MFTCALELVLNVETKVQFLYTNKLSFMIIWYDLMRDRLLSHLTPFIPQETKVHLVNTRGIVIWY